MGVLDLPTCSSMYVSTLTPFICFGPVRMQWFTRCHDHVHTCCVAMQVAHAVATHDDEWKVQGHLTMNM